MSQYDSVCSPKPLVVVKFVHILFPWCTISWEDEEEGEEMKEEEEEEEKEEEEKICN